MSETSGEWLALDRRALPVAAVDLLLLAVLVTVGVREHGTDPLAEPLATAGTMAPFLIAWLPIAVLAGLYAAGTLASLIRSIRLTAVGWLAAANVGLILRASPLFDGGASWPFSLVITGLGLLVLVAWRGALATVLGDR